MPTDLTAETKPESEASTANSAPSEVVKVESLINASATDSWGRLRWVSVGRPGGNVAITHAVRSQTVTGTDEADAGDESEERILLEIINLSEQSAESELTLLRGEMLKPNNAGDAESDLTVLSRQTLRLEAGERRRIWLVPRDVAERPVVARLSRDALADDNQVILMPSPIRPVRVEVDLTDPALATAVTQAMIASQRTLLVDRDGELLFTDRQSTSETLATSGDERGTKLTTSSTWEVVFDSGKSESTTNPPAAGDDGVQAFLGPFVVDRAHPMAEGVGLAGFVWAVAEVPGEMSTREGRPIVVAGSKVLLADDLQPDGRHRISWRLVPDRSTLLQSPAFPILLWNLIEWRQSERPGVRPVNTRPGVPIRIAVADPNQPVRVRSLEQPDAGEDMETRERIIGLDGRLGAFTPRQTGTYRIWFDNQVRDVAVLGTSTAESDLRGHHTAATGQWDDERSITREYRGLAWALGLLALVLLGFHAWWLYRHVCGDTTASQTGIGMRLAGKRRAGI